MLYLHLCLIVMIVAPAHQEYFLIDELFKGPFFLNVLQSEEFFTAVVWIIIICSHSMLVDFSIFRQTLFQRFELASGDHFGTVIIFLFPALFVNMVRVDQNGS